MSTTIVGNAYSGSVTTTTEEFAFSAEKQDLRITNNGAALLELIIDGEITPIEGGKSYSHDGYITTFRMRSKGGTGYYNLTCGDSQKVEVTSLKADITNKIVSDITARDAIPTSQRKIGMEVKVLSNGKKYELSGGTSNTNWKEVVSSGVETSTVTNLCVNSTFADGKNNWTTMDSTVAGQVTVATDDLLGYKAVLASTLASTAGIKQSFTGGTQGDIFYVGMWVKPTRKETSYYPRINAETAGGTVIVRLIDDAVWDSLTLNEWSYLSTYVTYPSSSLVLTIGRATGHLWTMEVTGITVANVTKDFANRVEAVAIDDFRAILAKKYENKYFASTMSVTSEDFILLNLSSQIEEGIAVGTSKAITNLCLNNNFATNDLTSWTTMDSTVAGQVTVATGGVVGNKAILASTLASPAGIVQDVTGSLNDVFYVGMWVKPTRKEATYYPRININNAINDEILVRLIEDTTWDGLTLDTWTYLCAFVTSPAGGISITLGRSTGQLYTMEISNIMCINLTQDLGSKAIGLRASDVSYMLQKYTGRHFASSGTLTIDDFTTATLAKLNDYIDAQV